MDTTHFIVIRPYREEDRPHVQSLIMEATLEPVNRFFIRALTRELFLQIVIMVAAVMYILCGVPLYYTFFSLPLTALAAYLVIWGAHWYKAKYLHEDVRNIMKVYMGSDKTCFLVADAYYNASSSQWKTEVPGILTEKEFQNINGKISKGGELTRELVGCLGVMRSKESAVYAWLRRTAVRKSWRGKGLGAALVERAIKFCSQKGFVGIELVTTECHDGARALYEKKGFELRTFYHKKFFNLSASSIMMYAMLYKTRPYKETTINL